MARLAAFVTVLTLLTPLAGLAQTYLLMAEQDGCAWCERWDKEISHIYPKTDEGRAAPLRRFDIHDDAPEVTFTSNVQFTPTFILVQDGAEVGRIEGYPGEDFFWGVLSRLFQQANISLENAG